MDFLTGIQFWGFTPQEMSSGLNDVSALITNLLSPAYNPHLTETLVNNLSKFSTPHPAA